MKKVFFTILLILLVGCLYFLIAGGIKASLMSHLSKSGMRLQSDTTGASNFEAKIYEIVYSLPVGSEPLGFFAESLLASRYEAFSAQSQQISLDLVNRLKNWPLDYTIEVDFSGSDASKEALLNLGPLSMAEWIDLSRTQVEEESLKLIIESAPNLEKLQLNETNIEWNPALIDYLIALPNLANIEVDEASIGADELKRLSAGLKK